jgi:hypothetical protein
LRGRNAPHLLFWRFELASIVKKDDCLILNVDEHIRLSIPIHISETYGYRNKPSIIVKQDRADIDLLMCRIAAWNFDYLNVAVEIKDNKMTLMER